MRVIYVSKYISYGVYGLETRHIYLSREIVKRGIEVNVIGSISNHNLEETPPPQDSIDGVKVFWLSGFNYKRAYGLGRIFSWFQFEWKLRKKLKSLRLSKDDILITSSLSLLTAKTGLLAKKKYGLKWIFEVRDIWPLILKGKTISDVNPIYKWLERIELNAYKYADIIIGTMPNLKSRLSSLNLLDNKSVLWIPHLINRSVSYAKTSTYEAKLDDLKQEGNILIGYAGSFNVSSALTFLLEAADILNDKNVHLVLMGDGPLRAKLVDNYKKPNIHFFQKQPQSEVLPFLSLCDFLYDGYLKLETYQYGNSRNKYVEYSLAKKPILLAYEGFPLFVEQYNCGVTVAPESTPAIIDGVDKLLKLNKEQRARMGENAYTFAQGNLTVEERVEELLRAIENVR